MYEQIDENVIQDAINALKVKDYNKATTYLQEALIKNPLSPVVQNLYGVLSELKMNTDLACKHYRAAYELDFTYKPAIKNLERITSFICLYNKNFIDYGDKPEEKQ